MLMLLAVIPARSARIDSCVALIFSPCLKYLPTSRSRVCSSRMNFSQRSTRWLSAGGGETSASFVTKPPKAEVFAARVRNLIQSKQTIDELSLYGSHFENDVAMSSIDVSAGQVFVITEDRRTLDQIRLALTCHHVHLGSDVEDALLVVRRASFDLIVVDLALRSTDGLALDRKSVV